MGKWYLTDYSADWLTLDDFCAHLPYKELVDRFHLECGAVEVAVLPLELRCGRIVLGVVLTARWQTVDVDILEFVNPSNRVLVEHAEASRPSLQHIVSEDVKLGILRLVLQHVDRLTEVGGENATALLDLNASDDRFEVFVFLLPEKLFEAEIINSKYVTDT